MYNKIMEETFEYIFKCIDFGNCNNKTFYEFGVFNGDNKQHLYTLSHIAPRFFEKTQNTNNTIVGIETFTGLCKEDNDVHNYIHWVEGAMNASKIFNLQPNEVANKIQSEIRNKVRNENVFIFASEYDSIKFEPTFMKKAIIVDIDCCTYTSTYRALSFLFENDLIDEQTLIRFDDWGGTPEFLGGESKALSDVCKKYNCAFSILFKKSYGGPHAKAVVKIFKIKQEWIMNKEYTQIHQKKSDFEINKSIAINSDADIERINSTALNKSNNIYISFVATARNDNYGGDFLYRLRNFISSIQIMSDKYELFTETIVVEWNPPKNALTLYETLKNDVKESVYNKITFITVPEEYHNTFSNPKRLPLHDYIGKNVGIYRAEGQFVLVCSSDLLFTEQIFSIFAKKCFQQNYMYRTTRIDYSKFSDEIVSKDNYDDFIQKVNANVFQDTYHQIRFPNVTWIQTIPKIDTYFMNFPGNYTNGCGDFLLMSKKDWFDVKGCFADTTLFTHLDGATLLRCTQKYGKIHKTLHPEYSIYHMDHARPHLNVSANPTPNHNIIGNEYWGHPLINFETNYIGCKSISDSTEPTKNTIIHSTPTPTLTPITNTILNPNTNPNTNTIVDLDTNQNKQSLRICYLKSPYSTTLTTESVAPFNINTLVNKWFNRFQNISFITYFEADVFVIDTEPIYATWANSILRNQQGVLLKQIHNTITISSINFDKYDIVISSDCIVPLNIIQKYSKVLWCYYEDEHAFESFQRSKKAPLGGYDVFLNHFLDSPTYTNTQTLPCSISFPYIEHIPTFRLLMKEMGIENTKQDYVFLDSHILRMPTFPSIKQKIETNTRFKTVYTEWDFANSLSDLCNFKLPHIKLYISKVASSSYFMYLRNNSGGIGQSMLPAAAAQCIIVGANTMKYAKIIIHPLCVATNETECINIIKTLESNPHLKEDILNYQNQKLENYFWTQPIEMIQKLFETKNHRVGTKII